MVDGFIAAEDDASLTFEGPTEIDGVVSTDGAGDYLY